ncbi:hypothetical protein [Vibrio cionasavignyae]|uniref:hypothetical protein n=1 Tax=Vibrio cionasavignyae TaxID=2910252 RepID=UPI003D0E8819
MSKVKSVKESANLPEWIREASLGDKALGHQDQKIFRTKAIKIVLSEALPNSL